MVEETTAPETETVIVRRPTWQVVAKWVAIILAGIAALLLLALVGLNTSPGKRLVADQLGKFTTATGLKVACELDSSDYPKGLKVSNAEMDAIAITGDDFHPEWNYIIAPRTPNHALVLR